MAKKFKLTAETTAAEIESELLRILKDGRREVELAPIIKIAEHLGAEYIGGVGGSAVRFRHRRVDTFGGYFSVHTLHRGKGTLLIRKNDYKAYILPILLTILT